MSIKTIFIFMFSIACMFVICYSFLGLELNSIDFIGLFNSFGNIGVNEDSALNVAYALQNLQNNIENLQNVSYDGNLIDMVKSFFNQIGSFLNVLRYGLLVLFDNILYIASCILNIFRYLFGLV